MNCLRCGRETQDDHAFCDSCKETMKKYPVRPGTAVILPKNKESAAQRRQKRHQQAAGPQDQIKKLKKQRRRLRISVFCLSLLLTALLTAAAFYLYREKPAKPGQNYVVVETTAAVQ